MNQKRFKTSILSAFIALFSITTVYGQCDIDLGPDTIYYCPSAGINIDYDYGVELKDSLEILYYSTYGVSGIVAPEKVYMHSTYELCAFCGGVNPWVGNWGADDGLGEMTYVPLNTYRFVIDPESYYGTPTSNMNGLFMVFRNADGSATGKDGTDQDIWVDMSTNPPSSAFTGVDFYWIKSKYDSLVWSDGSKGADFSITGAGTYSVIAYGDMGCVSYDTIVVSETVFASLDLGTDTTICTGNNLVLDAGSGWASTLWSDGDTNQIKSVNSADTYKITVGDGLGCFKTDSITLGIDNLPVAGFTTSVSGNTVIITDTSSNATSYFWDYENDGSSDSTIVGSHSFTYSSDGNYSIQLTTDNNCGSDSSIQMITITPSFTGTPCDVELGNDTVVCSGGSLNLDYDFSDVLFSDSLVIIYDATKGTSGLGGASKVYMHSTYEACPACGPSTPWIGNWGLDDGIGQMTSLGGDLWKIVIEPEAYYSISSANIHGLFIVFRNEDGTLTGKDDLDNDIWVDMGTNPPTSTFDGLSFSWIESANDSIIWNGAFSSPTYSIGSQGTYTVEVVGNNGCTLYDTISITENSIPFVDVGNDQTLCDGQNVTLDAGTGWASYLWTGGSMSQTLTVSSTGTYMVTVTDGQGCTGFDVVNVGTGLAPIASFSTSVMNGNEVSFTDNSQANGSTYFWDFDSDGIVDDTTSGDATYTYTQSGTFTVTLKLENNCGLDSVVKIVNVISGIQNANLDVEFQCYPNPAFDHLTINTDLPKFELSITNILGEQLVFGENQKSFDIQELDAGIYFVSLFDANHRLIRIKKLIVK